MRRAAISVPANIVEGATRKHKSEYLQFLHISISSLMELTYYIKFARDTTYIEENEYRELFLACEETVKVLRGLINYLERSNV